MKLLKTLGTVFLFLAGWAAAACLVPLGLIPEPFQRHVTDIVFGLGLVIAALSAVVVAIERVSKKQRLFDYEQDTPAVMAAVISLPVIGWMLVGWICAAAAAVFNTFLWAIDPATGRFPALVLCLPLTFATGLLLFAIRLNLRTLYGCIEVVVGLIVALWLVISASPEKPLLDFGPMVGFLTAGVYVVVRGMDNIHVGWKAATPDPFLRLLRFVFSRRSRIDKPTDGAVDA